MTVNLKKVVGKHMTKDSVSDGFSDSKFDNNQAHNMDKLRGGDLGGTVPPKFEVGGRPCIGPPNILRISVVGWARKLEQSKKIGVKEFFSEIVLFLVKKGSYTTVDTLKIQRIRKTWSMTKKRV